MCESCQYTPECSAKFYPIWCIGFGFCALLSSVYMVFAKQYERLRLFAFINLTVSISYILAGVLMMLGVRMDKRGLFKAGKIISYILPIVMVAAIFTIIVHVIAVINLCKYVNGRWG